MSKHNKRKVLSAFADCRLEDSDKAIKLQNPSFRAGVFIPFDEAVALLKEAIPHGYNAFSAAKLEELSKKVPAFKRTKVDIARECSVCLYLSGTLKDLKTVASLAERKLLANEVGFSFDFAELRLWWD